MPIDWKYSTIGEQVTLQRGIDITKAIQRDGNVPVVSSGGISSYHDTAFADGPGVILGRKGVVGSVYYVDGHYWPHDTTLWVRDFKGNHPRFVYYYFKYLAPVLASMDVGSANPTLNRNHVHPIATYWPPIEEQRRIAHILGTLDDKIELNRKMNQTLDELARTIFKSWFVDFDPVRAKMDGRQPSNIPSHIADLFPDRLVDTPHGPIPEGWEAGKLGDVLKRRRVLVPKESLSDNIAYLSLEHMPGRSIALDTWEPAANLASSKSGFSIGNVLFGQLRPYFHKVGVAPVDGVTSMDVIVMKAYENDWYSFGVMLAASDEVVKFAAAGSEGTRMPRTSWSQLEIYPIALPDQHIAAEFERVINPLLQLMVSNIHESQKLTQLRDTLIPKLLSGRMINS